MAADNHTTIVGNLVEDPELRFTNTGIAVTNLRVAVTQRIQQDGQWRDGDTSFFKINVWRAQAEHLADSLTKGDRVMVTGRLRQRSWEPPRGTSGRSPNWRPRRSAPPSSGPPPRSNGPASAATANGTRVGSGRPSAATSTTNRPSSSPSSGALGSAGALDFGETEADLKRARPYQRSTAKRRAMPHFRRWHQSVDATRVG
jgi:single-strand DNA-binding protein